MEPLYPKPNAGFDMFFVGSYEGSDIWRDTNEPHWYFIKSENGSTWYDAPRTCFATNLTSDKQSCQAAVAFAHAHYNLSH